MKNRPQKAEGASFGYPRPQLRRREWINLDGPWDFSVDDTGIATDPESARFDARITVPFAPETPASGLNLKGFIQGCWYRREFDTPEMDADGRLILHFGAVDFSATVWVNGSLAARHEGGYTPFSADITDLLNGKGPQVIVVHAADDPLDMSKPRGKQDWVPEPHSIWYFRTTGIWQSVWMEVVPATRIDYLRWTPDVTNWSIGLEIQLHGPVDPGMKLSVKLTGRDTLLCDDVYTIDRNQVRRTLVLPDSGIGRDFLWWWPHRPTLLDAEIHLLDAQGNIVDSVISYTAMRSASVLKERFLLNNQPCPLRLVLNQGYWEGSGLTAPDDDAYRKDVELIKALGFNGARIHQKIESPRFLFWADKLGLLVWEEMPSAYTFTPATIERVTREWTAVIRRDISHPCVIAWVPFNESWGVPDLPHSAEQRHFLQAIYHMTKSLDATRPVIGNDGWENLTTDILGLHDYDRDPKKIAARYAAGEESIAHTLKHEQPGGHLLLLDGAVTQDKPIMLTEFGGIAFSKDVGHTWGYTRAKTAAELGEQYHQLLATVRSLPLLAGFCYTQFTDTYQEANGLVYMDRTPKFPIEQIATATRGARDGNDEKIEAAWKKGIAAKSKL